MLADLLLNIDWYWALLIMLAPMIVLMMLGMPVAFSFLTICIIAVIAWQGELGLHQFFYNAASSVMRFSFFPIPLFVLMGIVIFHTGIARQMLDALDKLLGKVPGRLGLMAVAGGAIFATLSGSSQAGTAVLGSSLLPEMQKRGYSKSMSLGPILGSGGLAIMIPPSATVVFVAALGMVSIGQSLIAIIIPGLVMAFLYATYIIVRSWLQPHLALPYPVSLPPWRDRIMAVVRYILPLGFILFCVLGVIFMGIATPTEAAATGALSTFILAAVYRRLNWKVTRKIFNEALRITVMIFMIIVCAKTFAQLLAFSGASRGLLYWSIDLALPPTAFIGMIVGMLTIVGMFMSVAALFMIAVPLWMPIINQMGFSDVWFLVILCLVAEMATTTPPYGMNLFIMKSVAPEGVTMGDCYRAALPFLICDAIVMVLLLFFPQLALWLVGQM